MTAVGGAEAVPEGAAPGGAPVAVCVLGMHRSGTSLTARLRHLMGVDLGPPEHLAGSWSAGEAGFAGENVYLVGVNDLLLARLGGSWDRPPPLPAGWEGRPELADLRARTAALLAEEFGRKAPWGWKDPRNSLTLPWMYNRAALRHLAACRLPWIALHYEDHLERPDGCAGFTRLPAPAARLYGRLREAPAACGEDFAREPQAWEAGRGRYNVDR